MAHHRAITEPLPEEMNPVWCGGNAEVLSLAGVEEAVDGCNDREMTDTEFVQTQFLASVDLRSIDTCQSQSRLSENPGSIATNPSPKTHPLPISLKALLPISPLMLMDWRKILMLIKSGSRRRWKAR